jgi:hypothetical protein
MGLAARWPLAGSLEWDAGEEVMSRYRFLSDHWIGGQYFPAGTIASTADVIAGTLPVGWTPSGSVDPIDAPALAAFYAVGPQFPGNPIRTQFTGIDVVPAITSWSPVPGTSNPTRQYRLGGLGAALPPVQGGS